MTETAEAGGTGPDGEDGGSAGEMTLGEHLTELRSRILRIVLALLAGSVVGFALYERILAFLIEPYCNIPTAFRPDPEGPCVLVATRALEPFSVQIKVSLLFGAFVTGPVIFYQLWRFVTPGLTRRERRLAAPFVIFSQVLFAAGIAFAYVVIPRGLGILLGFGGDQIKPFLTADDYLSFLLTTVLAFGIVFEVPLVLVFLSLLGIVSSSQLRRFRPYALVANVAVAAVITPTTDAVTLLFMAVPMALLYEASILAAWLIGRRRREAGT